MSSSSVQPADALEVLAFARLCPLADGNVDNQSIEYEILRDADEDDEDEPDEVGWVWAAFETSLYRRGQHVSVQTRYGPVHFSHASSLSERLIACSSAEKAYSRGLK